MIVKRLVTLLLIASVALVVLSAPNPPKAQYDISDVIVYDNKLIVEGKEFYIKGFNYSPQPEGMDGILGNDGAGLCTPRKNSGGIMQSACFLEDYFDGQTHPDFEDHGPWFKPLWDRDFSLMKSMGVNAIRVYHMNTVTKSLLQKYPSLYPNDKIQYAVDHRPFFDSAQEHGIKIICPVADTEALLTMNTMDDLKRFVEARVDEVGDHPALLMWAVGNELGLFMKPALRDIVNTLMDYLREYTLQKWNRIVPVTTVEVDSPGTYYQLVNQMRVDVFTSNCGYRDVFIGTVFTWDSNPANNFPGWGMIAKYYGVPLLVGEYGMHEQDLITADRPDWINQQIKSMATHKKDGGIGFLFFEWNQEHLKPPNQIPMGIVKFESNLVGTKNSTKKGTGLLQDKAIQKPIVFEAAKQGLTNSEYKDWNYSMDIYALTGTTQVSLDLKTIPVRPFPTIITTPPIIPGFEPIENGGPEFICFGLSATDPNACDGHGTCIANDFCSCQTEWTGDQCHIIRQCYGLNYNDPKVCNGGGSCTGPDSCTCKMGYSGTQCSVKRTCNSIAFDSSVVCSGHGSCSDQDVCTCKKGYIGNNCEQRDETVPVESTSPPTSSPAPQQSDVSNSEPPGPVGPGGKPSIESRESSSAAGLRWAIIGGILAVLIVTPMIMLLQ
jgi:hypothetical protein